MVNLSINSRVLQIVKKIPKGRVASYKEIGKKLNIHPRAVARALSENPHPVIIPCHRVVHADGRIGGYTPRGQGEKIRILKKECVGVTKGRIDRKYFYFFK